LVFRGNENRRQISGRTADEVRHASLTTVLTVDQRKIHRVLYRPPFGVSDSDGRPRTPELPGPDVAEQSASGNRPVPAAGRSNKRGRGAIEGRSRRRYNHAESVNARQCPARRVAPLSSGACHLGGRAGASRLCHLFLTDNAHAGSEDQFTVPMDIAKTIPWSKFQNGYSPLQ
jgi:hypothetical protein